MPIPSFDLGLVLPPFLGDRPGVPADQSPYEATSIELVRRFGTSPERNGMLRGLLNLRAELRRVGISAGFQWIDGSFVEDKERRLGVGPGDIDIVTVFDRPPGMHEQTVWNAAIGAYLYLFDPRHCKNVFSCEAFYIDLGRSGQQIASLSAYWFGLFSHQRDTFRWKGIVKCPLGVTSVDEEADLELQRRGF